MAYLRTEWVNDAPPRLNATNLNKIEEGIEAAHTAIQQILDGGGGSGGGAAIHEQLLGRGAADSHPISAITGLQDALDGKQQVGDYLTIDDLPSGTSVPGTVVAAFAPATARPTDRQDVTVLWVGYDDQPAGFIEGVDLLWGTSSIPDDSDTTAPSAPTTVEVDMVTPTSVTVTWGAATDDVAVAGYEVSTNGTTWQSTGTNRLFTFTGLTPNTDQTLRVRAYDTAGNRGPTVTVTARTLESTETGDLVLHTLNYANRAALVSAGWVFEATTPSGTPRDTEFPGRPITYTPSGLVVPCDDGSLYMNQGSTKNTLFRPLPDEWSSVTLDLSFTPLEDYQQAGLALYSDDNNYTALTLSRHPGQPLRVSMWTEVDANAGESDYIPSPSPNLLLRMVRLGETNVVGSMSSDAGGTWTEVGTWALSPGGAGPLRLALVVAEGKPDGPSATLRSVSFRIGGEPIGPQVELLASGLDVPWGTAFLPDGDLLFTERGGQLRRWGANPYAWDIPVGEFDVPNMGNEGGLLGLALHPNFASNNYLYVYLTLPDLSANVVRRYTLVGNTLTLDRVILGGIPASVFHNGGQVAFGPDGMLYISTGDANEDGDVPPEENVAQDLTSLGGKILRVTPEGAIPPDNPYVLGVGGARGEIWSWGHRNPQGITWDGNGNMFVCSHGPWPGRDEVDHVLPGNNYGWPLVWGDGDHGTEFTPPIVSSPDFPPSWAFAQCIFLDGTLYVTGLGGQSLFAFELDGTSVVSTKRHFHTEYGRIRALRPHGGMLYFATSNRDQNGTPRPGDDRLFRVDPSTL